MPIIFVHGVAVRDESAFDGISSLLKRYVAPKLKPSNPEAVRVYPAYWGADAVAFAWGGKSRPRTTLLSKGGTLLTPPTDQALMMAPFATTLRHLPQLSPTPRGIRPLGTTDDNQVEAQTSLAALSREQKSDLVALAITAQHGTDPDRPIPLDTDLARRIIEADAAIDEGTNTPDAMAHMVPPPADGILSKGLSYYSDLRDDLQEAVSRVGSAPAFILTRALEELRVPLNDFVTRFTGDVFVYLADRGGSARGSMNEPPGKIPMTVIGVIARAQAECPHERTVVLTHSMGGQIVYDIVTRFMPDYPEFAHLRPIDLWCACASQVGLFEEMKLLLASDKSVVAPARVSHPSTFGAVKRWLNVWDRNDVISYTVRPIFEGMDVDDCEYLGGASLINAHGAYLVRPSFYKMLAAAL